jgi:uncharacterized protein (TIGR03032 family)
MTELTPAPEQPLRSVHTNNFPELLRRLGIALAVTTYQAGRLILVRADGNALNTHFHGFKKPMGMAYDRGRLAIGSEAAIWDYRNVPDVARKLEPPGRYDACFLPRRIHLTGDIDIHEMAWAGDELWFANTRFSCLCTMDSEHSFTPRWRPPFVSAYAPEDRCHLNGLGLRDGRPRYVTMLGESDSNESWRANKARGGLLMDVTTNSVLRRGLSMPHSPRWHREQLWLLESGDGSLARLEQSGDLITVAQLPGFTRGLDLHGNLAFIGLSQVRDSALFSGIPLAERLEERICGVWVVNIESGATVAFLRFEGAVQEIFSVQVLAGMRFPEIVGLDHDRVASSYILPDAALAEVARRG